MNRAQIFCIGASTMYGVGGIKGGLPDLLKQDLHTKMFGQKNLGEFHEVYNLAVPGAVISDLAERTKIELQTMVKPGRKVIAIVQLGANNAKAVGEPDNYVSTPEQYRQEASSLLKLVKDLSDEIICIGMRPMDQTKVMPINNDKEKGTKVYFPNERIAQFEKILAEACSTTGVSFVPLYDEFKAADVGGRLTWQDGIHPNTDGHNFIYEKLKPGIMALFS